MSETDPAASRFVAMNVTRLLGAAFVIVGMLLATGRILPQIPHWVGYILIANGLVDIFIIPAVMARKWRTPR